MAANTDKVADKADKDLEKASEMTSAEVEREFDRRDIRSKIKDETGK